MHKQIQYVPYTNIITDCIRCKNKTTNTKPMNFIVADVACQTYILVYWYDMCNNYKCKNCTKPTTSVVRGSLQLVNPAVSFNKCHQRMFVVIGLYHVAFKAIMSSALHQKNIFEIKFWKLKKIIFTKKNSPYFLFNFLIT